MRVERRSVLKRACLGCLPIVLAAACGQPPAAPAAPAATKKLPVIELDEKPAFPLDKHLESKDLASGAMSYEQVFTAGDKLFHASFNGLDGVGIKRTLTGTPVAAFTAGPPGGQAAGTGAQSCDACHNTPFAAGAGLAHARVIGDPSQKGMPPFTAHDATSLYGNGALQRLAEEMTEQLLAAREAAATEAKGKPGTPASQALEANGVDFGTITATANAKGEVSYDVSKVQGVLADLVIRPFGWKGNLTLVRSFSAVVSTFGMGMQAEEFVWRVADKLGDDPDGDGVKRELSVGDITAMTVYNAGQEAPSELGQLAKGGHVAAPDAAASARVEKGRTLFAQVGCASCHVPEMTLKNTVFEEPTLRGGGNFIDHFLASKDPDYDPKRPVKFDLLKDSQAPRIEAAPGGGAIVRLYGDLKRHDMGRTLAEPAGPSVAIDSSLAPVMLNGAPGLIGPSVFLTPELWGVGSTGPWMHDDRAGSIAEAIAMHGEDKPPAAGQPGRSEAQDSRDRFLKLGADDQHAIVAFLKSLVNFSVEGK